MTVLSASFEWNGSGTRADISRWMELRSSIKNICSFKATGYVILGQRDITDIYRYYIKISIFTISQVKQLFN